MQCPTCVSDNIQKLSILYENGTNDIRTQSRTTGSAVGFGRGGLGAGFGSAHTTTTGKSQSKLAQKAAPPEKKSLKPALYILAGVLLFAFTSVGMWSVVAVALIAFGGLQLYKAKKYNDTEWPQLYEAWTGSWHCNKCGEIFSTQRALTA